MNCYRVNFNFTFSFNYDYHTFGSVSQGTIQICHAKWFNKDLTVQKDKKNINRCQPEELLAILLQTETRAIAVQETSGLGENSK